MFPTRICALAALCLMIGCVERAAPPPAVTPEASGLTGVRPYPAEGSVCQVIGEDSFTNRFLGDSSLLVGCPTSQTGAIAARLAEGGRVVATRGDWTLITVPLR